MHLGMTGRFRVEAGPSETEEPGAFYYDAPAAPAHDHVVLHLSDGARVVYNDARRFGFMSLYGADSLDASPPFDGMGIEPLGPDLSGERLASLFAAGKRR
jgi:formamidopyrimidine-DNA glycosylase